MSPEAKLSYSYWWVQPPYCTGKVGGGGAECQTQEFSVAAESAEEQWVCRGEGAPETSRPVQWYAGLGPNYIWFSPPVL